MIKASKGYIDRECKLYPNIESFDANIQDIGQRYLAYSCWLNWEALLKECHGAAGAYRAESLGNSYFEADKIADDIYIISETFSGPKTYYIPHVVGVSEASCDNDCYATRDEAILAALTIKHLKNKQDARAITESIAKMIDMPQEKEGRKSMIWPKTGYLTVQKNTFPDVDKFFEEKIGNYAKKCVVYNSFLNWNALSKECADVATLFARNSYGDNFYDVSKISDDIYVVEETCGDNKYFWPYVPGKTEIRSSCCYVDFDSALIAAIATKYMNTTSCNRVADMVDVFGKLIDKPVEG